MRDFYNNITFHVIIIFCLSCTTGLIYNGLTTRGLPLLHHAAVLPENSELSLKQAYLAYRAGNAAFIDTRSTSEFAAGHIPYAVNIPSGATREEIMNFLSLIKKDAEIVVYCSNNHCDSARRLYGLIKYIGFTKVVVFADGFEAWHKMNFPVERQSAE